MHCHVTIGEYWFESPHRTSAKNPTVHDLYAGAAAAFAARGDCEAAGGTWATGIAPGTGAPGDRCYLGDGVLAALNPSECPSPPCDGLVTETGACADCHAPGIDGDLGGRDLLEASGHAYDYGVHCDVCHRIESIDPTGEAGVAGRVVVHRPSEESSNPGLGDYVPLTFGPWWDVPNIFMGAVQRELYHDGTLCYGCHELDQAVLVPGGSADPTRWPSGRLPVHTTYSEWLATPYAPNVACNTCHMPPDPTVGNGDDLGNLLGTWAGVAAGWYRPPGSVRKHAWYGPRQPESGMHQIALSLELDKVVGGGEVTANVTVRNVGCGHALPTGEPLRSIVLLVEATCSGVPLDPVGGPAVPDFGGWLDRQDATGDWTTWPGAEVGDVVRVVRRTGESWDYVGYGPFGDGTFDAAAKGMPVEEAVGHATIASMAGDVATFDRALPSGDVAYRVRGTALPGEGDMVTTRAGAPGFAFARVLVGADGERMVPHFLAVDVASDNRLLPNSAWTASHRFAATCSDPTVSAVVVQRAYPPGLATERAWTQTELLLASGSR
jgi:hypothetical protein